MSLKSGNYPWCVLDTTPDEENRITFICQMCKQTHSFDAMDLLIDRFVELSEAFCLLHKNCK